MGTGKRCVYVPFLLPILYLLVRDKGDVDANAEVGLVDWHKLFRPERGTERLYQRC